MGRPRRAVLWQLGSPGASLCHAGWMEMGVVTLSPQGFEACLKAESRADRGPPGTGVSLVLCESLSSPHYRVPTAQPPRTQTH